MQKISQILSFISGRDVESKGVATRIGLALSALALSLLFVAVFGVAAGATSLPLALHNVVAVPVVVLLAFVFALPAGAFVWKLSNNPLPLSVVLLAFAAAVMSGAMVVLVSSPLLALCYFTSAVAGPVVGVGATCIAVAVAVHGFFRALLVHGGEGTRPWAPFVATTVMFVVCLVQLISLASPILPEKTVFDDGVDGWVH